MNNLRKYVNLSACNAAPKKINSVLIKPTGVGSGLHSVPSDCHLPVS